MAELTITSKNFDTEVLQSDKPVLLDFWATWCGPCRMVAPIVAKIAEDFDGRLKVGKVNTDDETDLAISFKVSAIPTLVLIKNGQIIKTMVGYQTEAALVAEITPLL